MIATRKQKKLNLQHNVLDKTLKGIQVVCDSITKSFFYALGLWNKYFECFILTFNKKYYTIHQWHCEFVYAQ